MIKEGECSKECGASKETGLSDVGTKLRTMVLLA